MNHHNFKLKDLLMSKRRICHYVVIQWRCCAVGTGWEDNNRGFILGWTVFEPSPTLKRTDQTILTSSSHTHKHTQTWEEKKGSYLEKHSHGCDDPLLPECCTETVKVIWVVHVDLHLWGTEIQNYAGGGGGGVGGVGVIPSPNLIKSLQQILLLISPTN